MTAFKQEAPTRFEEHGIPDLAAYLAHVLWTVISKMEHACRGEGVRCLTCNHGFIGRVIVGG